MSISERPEVPTQIFDREAALARVGDDEILLAELVKIFLDDYPNNLQDIQQALRAGNPNLLERAAHTLKGAVANFGADAVVQEAFALECQGRKGDLSHANENLRRLSQVLEQLDHELRPIAELA
jgi:HPt (histidine-containing phosphotransfer) domain-containing protein